MPAACPGMLGGDNYDKLVFAQGLDMQPVCVRRHNENPYVQGAAQQALHRSIGVLRGHEQFYMRILCTKFPQDMWQNLIATITRRAHPQTSPPGLVQCRNGLTGCMQLFEDRRGIWEQHLTTLRQHDALTETRKHGSL